MILGLIFVNERFSFSSVSSFPWSAAVGAREGSDMDLNVFFIRFWNQTKVYAFCVTHFLFLIMPLKSCYAQSSVMPETLCFLKHYAFLITGSIGVHDLKLVLFSKNDRLN
jgi:hypothetical protein